MSVELIAKLAKCEYGKYFLIRSYSLELLFCLLESEELVGIEGLLGSLRSATPKFPAFLSYISLLESKGCIYKLENKTKRSQKVIGLTPEASSAIRSYFN